MTATPRVAGVGMTPFSSGGDADLLTLLERAATRALTDAGRDPDSLDSIHVGNMAAEAFQGRSGLGNALAGRLAVTGTTTDRVENTSASGASAFRRAVDAVSSGHATAALAVGGEVMTAADTATATGVIGSITHEREREQGVTLPSFGGLAAGAYLDRYDAPREALSAVAVKNHANAAKNPDAQFQTEITVSDVAASPLVASPLRLYDCSPMSDGAAAALVTDGDAGVPVAACTAAGGTHAVAARDDLLEIESVALSGDRAFEIAGWSRGDIDVACIHDAFSVLELLELEELGFYDTGTAWRATLDGETALDGALPVNPGGGLKARGHPLGATGLAQVVELVWQLRGDAGDRQVAVAERGLAVNVAGFGNNAVCTLLGGPA